MKVRILLVEDDLIAQKLAVFTLNDFGCQVDIAATGSKALELANTNSYNIIFMDMGLPDIDGLTVTETIRTQEGNKDIPIIALTAHSKNMLFDQCMASGITEFINKPLTSEIADKILDVYLHKD